jgi:hypothetical protein
MLWRAEYEFKILIIYFKNAILVYQINKNKYIIILIIRLKEQKE